ncbi:unnamed protein product [marine sediment metagenome]|uniref:Uncharacterized protein n=1 Tax=marine sediment metagenome TaxID=412755 RepID=X1QIQ2_9ZZZZ
MTLMDWLPLFPWEGPPLPRFLGICWPQKGAFLPALPSRRYITDIEEEPGKELVPSATYANEESWDITWNEDGLPEKIVVTRHATKT